MTLIRHICWDCGGFVEAEGVMWVYLIFWASGVLSLWCGYGETGLADIRNEMSGGVFCIYRQSQEAV
jgi:hypothetical protein